MSVTRNKTVSVDWVSKSLAGILLGFSLAMGCSAIFSWLTPDLKLTIRGQLAMWMVAPVWMGVLSSVYFFRSGKHAWAWLGAANFLVFGIIAVSRIV